MDRQATLGDRCRAIRLLVTDVDGVLTAGGIVHGTGGLEVKQFHVRDGFGLRAWTDAGHQSVILTGRQSPVVEVRAREVGITLVLQGVADKLAGFRDVLTRMAVKAHEVCYVGDDVPDLGPMRACGLAAAVADACPEARNAAHYVTRSPGGEGAIREVIELILRCQGKWA